MRRPTIILAFSLLTTLLLLAAPGWAKESDEVVEIDPGKWQVTTTSKFAAQEEPSIETEILCLPARYFSPERMVRGAARSCEIEKTLVSKREMSWKVSCKKSMEAFRGSGTIKSTGSEASGTTVTTMKMGGQSLVTEVSWEGKRLGDCGSKSSRSSKSRKQSTTGRSNKLGPTSAPAKAPGN